VVVSAGKDLSAATGDVKFATKVDQNAPLDAMGETGMNSPPAHN
jgi:hypothetical protein